MKFYTLNLQKNLNYYFIVTYTQINFRIFKSFNFLLQNFLKNYKYLVWFDMNYISNLRFNKNYFTTINNYNVLSFKLLYKTDSKYKYTRFLETSILNFNTNRFVFNQLKKNNNQKVLNNMLFIFINSIDYLYIIKFFTKVNYLTFFKNYSLMNFVSFKYYDKTSWQKNKLNCKLIFNLNFKFL